VLICQRKLKSGTAQAVLVNSGNANACTGPQGMKDAREMATSTANMLGLKPTNVFVCSTGVIGTPMPMQRVLGAIPGLIAGLARGSIGDIAAAIMTTDTFPKVAAREVTLGGKTVTISGVCKGAGMICPTMATMLCFLMTDARIDQETLKAALADAVEHSFNRISIDGDMSTNDTALILANGMAGNRAVAAGSRDHRVFSNALSEVADELATMIVKDGEGATKLVTVEVINARNERDALKGARAIADSLLVKTALYGNDANWGRLMAALGYAGISIREERVDVSINGVAVAKSGMATGRDREANEALKAKEVRLVADLHLGKGRSRVLTCDLTEDYVKINAEYRT
jgi:glutamate N-acetyltransferase/amino-acid N-acetyltransferase